LAAVPHSPEEVPATKASDGSQDKVASLRKCAIETQEGVGTPSRHSLSESRLQCEEAEGISLLK